MTGKSIFVSHAHQDNDWCRPFVAALKAVGYDVWYDEIGLQGGSEWVRTLEHEIETRDVFVVVLSPDAMASDWVRREIDLALATHHTVVPVMHETVPPEGFLRVVQWVDATAQDPLGAARLTIMAVEGNASRTAPELVAESIDTLATLCRALYSEQRYSEALGTCERALAIDNRRVDVWTVKALIYAAIGDQDAARRTIDQTITDFPDALQQMSEVAGTMHGVRPGVYDVSTYLSQLDYRRRASRAAGT